MSQRTKLNIIESIGFMKVGSWRLVEGRLSHNISRFLNHSKLLYSFVIGDEVMYIGKTVRTLRQRMHNYIKPGKSMKTSIRVNRLLIGELNRETNVQIYIWLQEEKFEFRGVDINLAAGLEDPLIALVNPTWNIVGRGRSSKPKNQNRVTQNPAEDSRIFKLTIWPAFYKQGFFNVRVKYDHLVRQDEGKIAIQLGKGGEVIDGFVNRSAQNNGTARIIGRKVLRDWFQENFDVRQEVNVFFKSQRRVVLYRDK